MTTSIEATASSQQLQLARSPRLTGRGQGEGLLPSIGTSQRSSPLGGGGTRSVTEGAFGEGTKASRHQGIEGVAIGNRHSAIGDAAQRSSPLAGGGTRSVTEGAASTFRAMTDPNSFQSSLDRAIAHRDPDEARTAAEQFVATSLVLPVLAHMREHNNAAPPFAPTQAERHFGAMLDGELADRIVKAANFPIVDRLARDLQRNTSGAETAG